VYEEYQKIPQAVRAYERVLAMPWSIPWIQPPFRLEAADELLRLYAALGQTDQLLQLSLRQFDLAPKNLAKGDILEQAARNFRAAGREADFTAWVVEQRDRATSPRVRAQLSWILHDHPGTIRAIAEAVKAKDPHLRSGVYSWRREFHNLGVKQECAFLKAYV